MASYDKDSIITLEGLNGIRQKLSMYAGSKENSAIIHAVKEILGNCIDEFLAGYGMKIKIKLDTVSNTIAVRDYARGIPHAKVTDAVTKQHTSGKFANGEGQAYYSSLGTHGVGLKVCAAIGTIVVISIVKGEKFTNTYTYNSIGEPTITRTQEPDGTEIIFTPDEGVVSDNLLYPNKILEMIVNLSYVTSKLTYDIEIDGERQVIKAKSLESFLTDNISEKDLISPIIRASHRTKNLSFDLAMVWTKRSSIERTYVNLSNTSEGGTHLTALKTTLTREINKIVEGSLTGDEIRQGLAVVLSVEISGEVIFSSQEKTKLVMPAINAELSGKLRTELQAALLSNKDFFEKLSEVIAKARQKEAAMLKVRDSLSQAKTKMRKGLSKLVRALNTSGLELFITEGDSASTGLVSYRDKKTQAIMPLRGKPLNVLKSSIEKVLENQEIQDLIVALGDYENFAVEKCPYEKIIITTDADSDGSHIRLLLFGFLYNFYPSLLTAGRVYALITPLYSVKVGTKTTYYYTEGEMDAAKKNFPKTAIISRFKGLGEVDNRELANWAFNKNRKIVQYELADFEATGILLDEFIGKDLDARREMIAEANI